MKRSLATSMALAVASPLVLLATAGAPAQAAGVQACNTPYPPNSAYQVARSPASVTIRSGSTLTLYVRLTRGQTGCDNQAVRFFTKNSSQPAYIPAGYAVSGSSPFGPGFIERTGAPPRTFVWVVQFKNLFTSAGAVVVRP